MEPLRYGPAPPDVQKGLFRAVDSVATLLEIV